MILPATALSECESQGAALWVDRTTHAYYVTVAGKVIAQHPIDGQYPGLKARERAYQDYRGAVAALEAERYGGRQP